MAVVARRRLYEGGHAAPLLAALEDSPELAELGQGSAVLDVGCGEGWMLARLAQGRGWEAHGLDLSAPAIELAVRLAPSLTWVIANADRFLPYGEASLDLVFSLTARLPVAELRRVLRPAGRLVVAVAGPEDLGELREAVLGARDERRRLARVEAELEGRFELCRRHELTWKEELSAEGLRDLLTSSYRGARHGQQARVESLNRRVVTMGRDIAWFRPI